MLEDSAVLGQSFVRRMDHLARLFGRYVRSLTYNTGKAITSDDATSHSCWLFGTNIRSPEAPPGKIEIVSPYDLQMVAEKYERWRYLR